MKRAKKLTEAQAASKMARAVRKEIERLGKTLSPPEARYEGAVIPYQTRSWLYEGVQDAEYDIDPYTRTELLRVSRYFEKNSWVVKRLIAVFNQYTFGSHGIAMVPASNDTDFNVAASDWWAGWSKFPSLDSPQPLGVLEHVMGRRWFVDGEIWIYKTQSPDTRRPRIQLIEAHRVLNPGTDISEDGNKIRDGIELDEETGRPLKVYVAQAVPGALMGGYQGSYMNSGLLGNYLPNPLISQNIKFLAIPVERMLHLMEPERAQQRRALGSLYPVLRTIQDLHEINYLEKLRAKDLARLSAWITNTTGQANPRGLRAMAAAVNSLTAQGKVQQKPSPQWFETAEGAETHYLKIGEDVKFPSNPNPSASAQWFYDYLVRQICAGTGISALLVMPWSLQGTVTRADLDIMSGFFRCKSSVAIAIMRELYVWAMGWAVRFDPRLDGSPDDWAEVTARPPRSPNVDVGRNSAALIAEYEEGFRNLSDICGEMGHDWRHVIRQKAMEAKFIEAMAKEFGVEPEKIQQLAKQSLSRQEPEEKKTETETKTQSAEIAPVL